MEDFPLGAGMGIGAFNRTMNEWINQTEKVIQRLKDISDSEKQALLEKIKIFKNLFEKLKSSSDPATQRKPLDLFMHTFGPYEQYIIDRNEELWKLKFPTGSVISSLQLNKYWSYFSEKTKNGMFEFLNMLLTTGKILQLIPPEALPQVETIASQMLQNTDLMQNIQSVNPQQLMSMIPSLLNSQLPNKSQFE
jgi:hypothetical protein